MEGLGWALGRLSCGTTVCDVRRVILEPSTTKRAVVASIRTGATFRFLAWCWCTVVDPELIALWGVMAPYRGDARGTPSLGGGAMHGRNMVGLCGVLLAVSGCGDNRSVAGPQASRQKWGWDQPLATGTYAPTLICSPTTVAHGGTVTCSFANGTPLSSPSWSFTTDSGLYVGGPYNVADWSGPMISSGTVRVNWFDESTNGPGLTLEQPITVQRRNWTWVSQVGGRRGNLGEIDTCFDTTFAVLGLTASNDCTSATAHILYTPSSIANGAGYVAAQVPTALNAGPNRGLWYVSSVSATMDLRTQRTRKFRSDGDTVTLAGTDPVSTTVRNACQGAFGNTNGRNHVAVNTVCVDIPAFAADTVCTWAHEAAHLDSATVAAKLPINDVHKVFEARVRPTPAQLQTALSSLYDLAWQRVLGHARDSAHKYMTTASPTYFFRTSSSQPWKYQAVAHLCP